VEDKKLQVESLIRAIPDFPIPGILFRDITPLLSDPAGYKAAIRKPGKLPGAKHTEEYELEYGTNSLEIHSDAVGKGQKVLVVDDLLATGGTAAATGRLLDRLGADILGFAFLIELRALEGRKVLVPHEVTSFISY
jgi:adenine phosphoribosyltransferase